MSVFVFRSTYSLYHHYSLHFKPPVSSFTDYLLQMLSPVLVITFNNPAIHLGAEGSHMQLGYLTEELKNNHLVITGVVLRADEGVVGTR